MTIHIVCFWGIGMAGGWWLCFRGLITFGVAPMGLAGFWWAATAATVVASVMFVALLRASLRRTKSAPAAAA